MLRHHRPLTLAALALGCLFVNPRPVLFGEDKPPAPRPPAKDAPRGPNAWTFDEAMKQLARHPRDPYLQYVVLQVGRREEWLQQAVRAVDDAVGRPVRPNDRSRAELFGLFTGALAIQESLQLDALRGDVPRGQPVPAAFPAKEPDVDTNRAPAPRIDRDDMRRQRVKVADLKGPTVRSHPWDKMLAGRKPDVGRLARCVPEDFYLAEFRSAAALMAALDTGELWGNHLFSQVLGEARTRDTIGRIKQQLGLAAVKADELDRLGVEGVAVTGSDLYLADGSDVTILFHSNKMGEFRAYLNEHLAKVEQAVPGAKRTSGTYRGVDFLHVETPDRSLCVYEASPEPGLHVRSTSRVAFERVLGAIRGEAADGTRIRRLGDAKELAYIRTLLPRGTPDEDGFIYLSDPFIRRLVGPGLKIAAARRMVCHNHLRMIGHACLLFRTEHGRPPASFKELADSGCAPGVFGEGSLICPDRGNYRLADDGMSGVCSIHGTADNLRPCCENPVTEVDGLEAEDYRQFVRDYSEYWKTYFDPIALRVEARPDRQRLETVILPLLDNTIYTTLAAALGGKEVPMDAMPVSKRNIFTLAFKVNKERLSELLPDPAKARPDVEALNQMHQIGVALFKYDTAFGRLPADILDKKGKPLLSWRVALLPFLEQEALYKEFKLDEPWDSDHNRKLLAKMPRVFHTTGTSEELCQAGKTRYLGVADPAGVFAPGGRALTLLDFKDGTTNTIVVVRAEEERAVEWTRPADWKPDPRDPLAGLTRRGGAPTLALMGDGSVRLISPGADPEAVRAALTIAGGEKPADFSEPVAPADNPAPGLLAVDPLIARALTELVGQEKVRRLVRDGIGDQVALNIHDSARLFEMDWGMFRGDQEDDLAQLGIGFLVHLIGAPVSIGVPVKDAKVVDTFLDDLGKVLADRPASLPRSRGGWLDPNWRFDQYRTRIAGGHTIHCEAVSIFGLKFRLFWGRVGGVLYFATRAALLEELAEAESGKRPTDTGPRGHALLRVRPENWNLVLPGYRLGWAENDRQACAKNLVALSNVSRGWNDRAAGRDEPDAALLERTARLYGVRPFCPEGGRYSLSPDGRACRCSIHGSDADPRQPAAPSEAGATGRLVKDFAGLSATLTFTEEGLRAVVEVRRK